MRIGISLPVRELRDDLGAIREFAQEAEALGFTHLRVPDVVLRPGGSRLHEPMMLLAWIAAGTTRIELVPSVIVTPSRQTVLLAKQAAELDLLSGGRSRLGVGVGGSREEFAAMGADFGTRGARLEEQIELMRALWNDEAVTFEGRWDSIPEGMALAPRPGQPIPIWIGAGRELTPRIAARIGRLADGWFVLANPEDYAAQAAEIDAARASAGRPEGAVGAEASIAVAGDSGAGWEDRVREWGQVGLTHACVRTLGAGLEGEQHAAKMAEVASQVAELSTQLG